MIERDIAKVALKETPKKVESTIIPITEVDGISSEAFKISEFLRGGIASMVNITATYPVYKLVFRQQVFGLKPLEALSQLRTEGFGNLYRGIGLPLISRSITCGKRLDYLYR